MALAKRPLTLGQVIRFLVRLSHLIRSVLYSLKVEIESSVVVPKTWRKATVSVFSIELHASVSLDAYPEFKKRGIEWTRLSLSEASQLFGEPNTFLRHLSTKSWANFQDDQIGKFMRRYRSFIHQHDGYLCSHSFSLLELFEKAGKPIFAINSTRFESPFTSREVKFYELIERIQNLSSGNLLDIVSNNLGDRDYLKFFSGVSSDYIPSICGYSPLHNPKRDEILILSRDRNLGNEISKQVVGSQTLSRAFARAYSHQDFAEYAGVILIPYNISTMRLFEISTSGMPVFIPTDELLLKWVHMPGVLSELSWVQVQGINCPPFLTKTPADPTWSDFYEWWLSRADWKNREYFPNVTEFSSLKELSEMISGASFEFDLAARNARITEMWSRKYSTWISHLDRDSYESY